MIISTRPTSSLPLYLRLQQMAERSLQWLWPQPVSNRTQVSQPQSDAGHWRIFDPVTHEEVVVESEADARAWLDQHWQQQEANLAQILQTMIPVPPTTEPHINSSANFPTVKPAKFLQYHTQLFMQEKMAIAQLAGR